MKRGLTKTCYGFFSTLANPTRLAILEKLSESNMNVTQLAESIGHEQSMISHNLKSLVQCRFVYSKRMGKSKVYSINEDTIEALFKIVENHVENDCLLKGNCRKSHL